MTSSRMMYEIWTNEQMVEVLWLNSGWSQVRQCKLAQAVGWRGLINGASQRQRASHEGKLAEKARGPSLLPSSSRRLPIRDNRCEHSPERPRRRFARETPSSLPLWHRAAISA